MSWHVEDETSLAAVRYQRTRGVCVQNRAEPSECMRRIRHRAARDTLSRVEIHNVVQIS